MRTGWSISTGNAPGYYHLPVQNINPKRPPAGTVREGKECESFSSKSNAIVLPLCRYQLRSKPLFVGANLLSRKYEFNVLPQTASICCCDESRLRPLTLTMPLRIILTTRGRRFEIETCPTTEYITQLRCVLLLIIHIDYKSSLRPAQHSRKLKESSYTLYSQHLSRKTM